MLCACRPFPVITWVSTAGILALPERERPRESEGDNRKNKRLHHFLRLPCTMAIRTARVHPSRCSFQGSVSAHEIPFVRQRARLDAGENALHFIDLLALRFDGLVAEPLDLGIADLRLSATFSMGMPLRAG